MLGTMSVLRPQPATAHTATNISQQQKQQLHQSSDPNSNNDFNMNVLGGGPSPKPSAFPATRVNTFDSTEFRRFFKSDGSPTPDTMFLSKNSAVYSMADMFKSNGSFGGRLYSGNEWEMDYTTRKPSPRYQAGCDDDDVDQDETQIKKFPITADQQEATSLDVTSEEAAALARKNLKSEDWMPLNTLGPHVETGHPLTPKDMGWESSDASSSHVDEEKTKSVSHNDWFAKEFYSKLGSGLPSGSLRMPPITPVAREEASWGASQLPPVPVVTTTTSTTPSTEGDAPPALAEEPQGPVINVFLSPMATATVAVAAATYNTNHETIAPHKKTRRRAPRKKIVPANKVYCEPTTDDVLLGRGGRSNHHGGNKRYRAEVENLKEWYSTLEDKDDKTDLSQCLIESVHSYGGRFLELDKEADRWYQVPNLVARRKASQALREDSDPQKRAAKRQRFLAKRRHKQAGGAVHTV